MQPTVNKNRNKTELSARKFEWNEVNQPNEEILSMVKFFGMAAHKTYFPFNNFSRVDWSHFLQYPMKQKLIMYIYLIYIYIYLIYIYIYLIYIYIYVDDMEEKENDRINRNGENVEKKI